MECYERLKAKGSTGAAVFHPTGTPLTYALTERATHDQIPLLTIGYGRSDTSDGRVFPYLFTPPVTWWSLDTAKIRFIGQRAGGMEQLKGLKIAHVYLDNDCGRETLPLLNQQAAQYGFTVQHLAVKHPGLDKKATWLRVKMAQPDWVLLRGVGAMNPIALKEAAQVGFPRDRIVESVGPCAAGDGVTPRGAARRYICETSRPTEPLVTHNHDIHAYVYGQGPGPEQEDELDTVSWARGPLSKGKIPAPLGPPTAKNGRYPDAPQTKD